MLFRSGLPKTTSSVEPGTPVVPEPPVQFAPSDQLVFALPPPADQKAVAAEAVDTAKAVPNATTARTQNEDRMVLDIMMGVD